MLTSNVTKGPLGGTHPMPMLVPTKRSDRLGFMQLLQGTQYPADSADPACARPTGVSPIIQSLVASALDAPHPNEEEQVLDMWSQSSVHMSVNAQDHSSTGELVPRLPGYQPLKVVVAESAKWAPHNFVGACLERGEMLQYRAYDGVGNNSEGCQAHDPSLIDPIASDFFCGARRRVAT